MVDSGVVIRGGNISITGVRVDALPDFQAVGDAAASLSLAVAGADGNGSTTSNSSSNSTSALAAVPGPKPRKAAFNGSLGFYTLGMKLEVIGDFVLQVSAGVQILFHDVWFLYPDETASAPTNPMAVLHCHCCMPW